MSHDPEKFNEAEQEPEPTNAIRVGGGDPIKVLKVVEEVERKVGGVMETVKGRKNIQLLFYLKIRIYGILVFLRTPQEI